MKMIANIPHSENTTQVFQLINDLKSGMDLLGGGGLHTPSPGQRGAGGGGAIFHASGATCMPNASLTLEPI